MVLQADGRRNDSGPASPSGRGNDRHLRVHGHSKLVKEFTDLCIVQELNAHNGVSQGCSFAFSQIHLLCRCWQAPVPVCLQLNVGLPACAKAEHVHGKP